MIAIRVGSQKYEWGGELETYFQQYRKHIIGNHQYFQSPYGRKQLIYADWTASGRLYRPIETKLSEQFGSFMANTHTESNVTSSFMTAAYDEAKRIIKRHVNANEQDVIIMDGAGMTSVVNRLQRILGIKAPEKLQNRIQLPEEERPVIFITHMEHHSNDISWRETIGDVEMLEPCRTAEEYVAQLKHRLSQYRNRIYKIGSFTACSNVTGIQTPYYQLARTMHEHGGICFIDFAASAPYVHMNMHPDDPMEKLDGIFFSPHKFLGGPGSSGVLIFDSRLYSNAVPDHPGGGTVTWTNPWGGHQYVSHIESREDGGTPGIMQGIRAALCIKLKEQMGIDRMLKREEELVHILLPGLKDIPGLHILDGQVMNRLGIVSFFVENVHYNLVVRLLNDKYGFQVRGGCSCAGPYGHYLLGIDKVKSKFITDALDAGDLSKKPGWVRVSLHPTMTNEEVYTFTAAMREIVVHMKEWEKQYVYDAKTNDYFFVSSSRQDTSSLFSV